jgi:hypothetical protein
LKEKRKIKMSVFAAVAMALPPGYSSTTRQPPPAYKQGVSHPLTAPSIPPPVYKTTRSTTTTISPRSSLSTITSLELPQYASIISAPRPKPPPSATCQSTSSAPTWKDPYVETDAADSVYELEQRNSRQREQQQQQEEDDSMKNWCWGCFWVGPYTQHDFVAPLIF